MRWTVAGSWPYSLKVGKYSAMNAAMWAYAGYIGASGFHQEGHGLHELTPRWTTAQAPSVAGEADSRERLLGVPSGYVGAMNRRYSHLACVRRIGLERRALLSLVALAGAALLGGCGVAIP
jgi:hypothetical protein